LTLSSFERRISVVIVLHNSADTILESVASVAAEAELILVDNASSDDGVQRALSVRPDAVVIRSENRGFGAGCNLGVSHSSGDVLIFLNPDAVLHPGALEIIAERTAQSPPPIVGPELQAADGTVLHAVRRARTPLSDVALGMPVVSRFLPTSMSRDLPDQDPIYSQGGEVSYVQGACFAVEKALFERLGGFDERFFLYFEEEDLCLRAKQLGSPTIYEPDAKVMHLWGTSIGKVSGLAGYHVGRSRVIFYRKWFAAPTAVASGVGVLLGAGLTLSQLKLRVMIGDSEALRERIDAQLAQIRGLRAGLKVVAGR